VRRSAVLAFRACAAARYAARGGDSSSRSCRVIEQWDQSKPRGQLCLVLWRLGVVGSTGRPVLALSVGSCTLRPLPQRRAAWCDAHPWKRFSLRLPRL
jgi:hypothetical protein